MQVTFDKFNRAETARMFDGTLAFAGGMNVFAHNRRPTPLDQQNVIRMNRDSLYSQAVVNLTEGATVTVPDAGTRYLSVMIINEEHYLEKLIREPGTQNSLPPASPEPN